MIAAAPVRFPVTCLRSVGNCRKEAVKRSKPLLALATARRRALSVQRFSRSVPSEHIRFSQVVALRERTVLPHKEPVVPSRAAFPVSKPIAMLAFRAGVAPAEVQRLSRRTFQQPLLASRSFPTATVIKFAVPAQQRQGRSVALSMVIHRVHDNSDDDCNGYTNIEDGIFEWNLRW
jgi:hypothetical protein